MSVMSLKEVHQKLLEYGVTEKVLEKLPVAKAMNLLNHKRRSLNSTWTMTQMTLLMHMKGV